MCVVSVAMEVKRNNNFINGREYSHSVSLVLSKWNKWTNSPLARVPNINYPIEVDIWFKIEVNSIKNNLSLNQMNSIWGAFKGKFYKLNKIWTICLCFTPVRMSTFKSEFISIGPVCLKWSQSKSFSRLIESNTEGKSQRFVIEFKVTKHQRWWKRFQNGKWFGNWKQTMQNNSMWLNVE